MLAEVFALYAARRDFFLSLTLEHLLISGVSIALAAGLGLLLGVAISEYRRSSPMVLGLVNFVYTIPAISLLGFLIPFSGIGDTTAIIALTVYALLPMVRGTYAGLNSIDPTIVEAARGMGSTRTQILYKIKLPLALPVILAGVRSMVVMTIALAGIASFIGAGGLGVAIYRGITTNNAAMTVAGSLLIAALALALDWLVGGVERAIRKKREVGVVNGRLKKSWAAGLLVVAGISLVLSGYFGEERTVRIATKPMTEQFILGDMLALLIEQDTDLRVDMTQGVGGGTGNIHPALLKGDFDLYPEYTGTAWNYVLKKQAVPSDNALFAELVREYRDRFQLEWVGLYGFNNTFGLVVRRDLAEKFHLKTCSDLAAVTPDLAFGAEYDFYEREDGYAALCAAYGFHFKKRVDLDIGLKYMAIAKGEIDVMTVFTTDGQLSVADVSLLEDDRNFYPTYYCGTVVRADTLKRFPELRVVLMKMDRLLDGVDMARLNYEVEGRGRDTRDVARDFLRSKGLLS